MINVLLVGLIFLAALVILWFTPKLEATLEVENGEEPAVAPAAVDLQAV